MFIIHNNLTTTSNPPRTIYLGSKLIKLLNLRMYKGFKKTIKFKKFNLGFSKNIINRKRYIKKKRKRSNVIFQKIVFFWSYTYAKKRRIASFSYFILSFTYTFLLPNIKFLRKEFLHKNNNSIPSFNIINSPTKVYYNKSLCAKSFFYFKNNLTFFDNTYVLTNQPILDQRDTPNLTSPINYVFIRDIHASISQKIYLNNIFLSLNLLILRLVLALLLEFRKVLSSLLLLSRVI